MTRPFRWELQVSPIRRPSDREQFAAKAYVANAIARPTPARFLIVTTGRSGSTVLVDALGSLPGVRCDGEIIDRPTASPRWLLEGRSRLAQRQGMVAYGAKVITEQLGYLKPTHHPDRFLRGLHDSGWHIIHLRRRNLLRQAISAERARLTGEWHRTADPSAAAGSQRPATMTLDPVRVVHVMAFTEARSERLEELLAGIPHERLCYEDDVEQPEDLARTCARLCPVLGIEAAPPQTSLRKLATRRPSDEIQNYTEIADILGRTRFQTFLEA